MIEWTTGLDNFKKHTLDGLVFTTELTDQEFEPNRTIDQIFLDHIPKVNKVEILYSGGLDSELVLASCLRNNIPVEAMTMVIKIKGAILNVVDLYYSEKFCRENNVKQNLFHLDATDFFEGNQYLEYLLPFGIIEPHVATHFWLLEKCQGFPIIGGDWPWVQVHKEQKVLSPFKLAFSSYERFLQNKNMDGIGNMISHSYESCHYFMKAHIREYTNGNDTFHLVPFMKYKMYGVNEPRIKSYGWEQCPAALFNINRYKVELIKKIGAPQSKIVWGDKTSSLLGTDINENTSFT
jgi:hypothetical protein